MTQNDFNAAFQQQVSGKLEPPPHDPRYITNQILRRDQRRTRILAALSLSFWLIGTAGMLLMVVGLDRFILMMRIEQVSPGTGSVLPGTDLIHHSIPFIECSIISLMLAALFTVMLIFSSRQATLNRIHISLAQMSEQLRRPVNPAATTFTDAPAITWDELRFPRTILAMSLLAILACGITVGVVVYHSMFLTAARAWQGYPTLSPFQAVRWNGVTPTVEVNGTWYQLHMINNLDVSTIVAFDMSQGEMWQKHFEEDLVELMTKMGHPPGNSVDLFVALPGQSPQWIRNVPMTAENRWALWSARQKAERWPATSP